MRKCLSAGAVLAWMLLAGGCAVHQTVSGPSDVTVLIGLTATPVSLATNGSATSAIQVLVQNDAGVPQASIGVHLDVSPQGCGQIAPRDVTTGANGSALAVFTVPAPPIPSTQCSALVGSKVTILASPSGSNVKSAISSNTTVLLLP